jgi:8-oxo-dGTP pyrophosphatase MutT (NUDIX family)
MRETLEEVGLDLSNKYVHNNCIGINIVCNFWLEISFYSWVGSVIEKHRE